VRLNDAVIGAVLVIAALLMIWHTRTFPSMPGQDYGPALFPVLIGIGFIVTGAILITSGLRRRARAPMIQGGDWLRSRRHVACFLAVVLGLLAYVLVSNWLGFIPTAVILLFVWLVLFRDGKPLSSFVIAVAVTLIVNYAFTQFLLVPLPLGLLTTVVY
jgi:putative tricarboxylic transport membrane protein